MRRFIIAALAIILCSHAAWAISPPALGAPSGMSPPSVQFVWTAVSGATWYRVWVSKDSSPSSAVVDSWVELATALNKTLAEGNYTCWLQSWGPAEGYSSWSSGFTFTVAEQKEISFSSSAFLPEDNADTYTRHVSFLSSGLQNWYLPFELPVGTEINSVHFHASNMGGLAANSGPEAFVYRYGFDGTTQTKLATISLKTETAFGAFSGMTSAFTDPIIRSGKAYEVKVSLNSSGTVILGVTIVYSAP